MISKDSIKNIIVQTISETTIFLVDIQVSPSNKIFVEADKPDGITIEECVNISKAIEHSLDREVEDYELEVSSPGLTEPFKVIGQYHKNSGRLVEVLKNDGQKINGIMQYVDDSGVVLEVKAKVREEGKKRPKTVMQSIPINFNEIKATKVTITF